MLPSLWTVASKLWIQPTLPILLRFFRREQWMLTVIQTDYIEGMQIETDLCYCGMQTADA